jgi:peptidoglycan pentaglycine glycine transferase (the first glycine)
MQTPRHDGRAKQTAKVPVHDECERDAREDATLAGDVDMTSHYRFHVSDAFEDPKWDSFLAETPGGHHVQTSLWAQVKATVGVQAVRVLATNDGELIGGGQVLMSNLPIIGVVGYVARGPVTIADEPLLSRMLLEQLRAAAKDRGVRHLTIQPPTNRLEMTATLEDEGFRSTSQTMAPPASVVVDLSPSIDDVMSNMRRKTRYNIRLADRRGVTVRSGGESDLDTYCRMVEATAQRQGFRPFPPEYYATMWRVLNPRGYLRLTIAEFEGETIAAQFTVPFGDTVINKLGVWPGRHGDSHPNEALHWDAMKWSKEHGYRFYDFEGIDLRAARALSDGEALPPDLGQSVTSFKLGFGGDVRIFPGAYFDASNAMIRWLYDSVFPKVSRWEPVRKGVAMLRTSTRPAFGRAKTGLSR